MDNELSEEAKAKIKPILVEYALKTRTDLLSQIEEKLDSMLKPMPYHTPEETSRIQTITELKSFLNTLK